METFGQLKKYLKEDFSNHKLIKVALVGDTATQFLTQAIRGYGYKLGLNLQIWEADFNQIDRQVFDASSEMYSYDPEIIIIFHSSHKLLAKYNKLPLSIQLNLADNHIDLLNKIVEKIESHIKPKILYFNFAEIDDAVFGNYANKVESSFLFQIRKLNYKLMEFAVQNPNFHVCDLSSIQNQSGKTNLFSTSIYVNTDMVLGIDILPAIAAKILALIGAIDGKFKKCLILDLDNTIWGGVIGDDGIENIQLGGLGIGKAFTEFQHWILKLKNRGIILAVCSKNTEAVAKEPFEKHPDMVLHLNEIAVFVANWENKVDNIRLIQNTLNIGFDSIVFLDDNPFERNMVKENIKDITVPELPEDPADYLEYLYQLNLFETVSLSNEDHDRTRQYQISAIRNATQNSFVNEDEYLNSLDMMSVIEPFNKFNTPRVAQLSQRSNQFNLRTVRYSEADIEVSIIEKKLSSFTFTLEDKFGNNGMICVVILNKADAETLFIDTWFMSCRVLKRGMENFVLNTLVEFALKNGFVYLKGEYIATIKNQMVKDHYKNLGFIKSGDCWVLDVVSYLPKKVFITAKLNNG